MSNAGGKATNAGVDYQQRVAAWFMPSIWLELDASDFLGIPGPPTIESIGACLGSGLVFGVRQ